MTNKIENLLNSLKEWALENPQKRTIVCAIHDGETDNGSTILTEGTKINVATTFAMIPMHDKFLGDMLPTIYKATKEINSDDKQLEDEKPPMQGIIISNVNKKKIVS
jgi:hypothetical protein